MNTEPTKPLPRAIQAAALVLFSTLFLCPTLARAQAAPAPASPPAAAEPPAAEQTVTLDPFEVKTEKDTSYGALNSNSLIRFNVELEKTPISADIITHEFMEDTQVRSVEELFNGYGAGAGQTFSNENADNSTQPGDRFSQGQFNLRGIAAGTAKRDGFSTGQMSTTNQNSTSTFDVERLDILHGSQGLLYGATGAGGLVNVVSKQASFNQTKGEISERIDQYGSHQSQLDFNTGKGWAAARVVLLHDANQTRRLFIGDTTNGWYGQLAFKLPLNTTLRLVDEETHNNRVIPINANVSFAGSAAAADPRNGLSLTRLFFTNQLGAINPATGLPYPGGAIDNGHLNRDNLSSLQGWHNNDLVDTTVREVTADTVWTKWLSTSFGAYTNKIMEMRDPNGSNLLAPGATNNPTGDWAVSPSFTDSSGPNRQKAYRANAMFTNELFDGKAHSQTAIGFNREYQDQSTVVWQYFKANADGSVSNDPTNRVTALGILGRGAALPATALPWAIGNGPIKYAYYKPGAMSIDIPSGAFAGHWVRTPVNPTNKAWIIPGNPLGLASLYQASLGIPSSLQAKGANDGIYSQQERDQGYYVANYTSWFEDKYQTLFGIRRSDVFIRAPNESLPLNQGDWQETRSPKLPSYNAGLVGRLMALPGEGTLRAYYGYSRTFNAGGNILAPGSADPYGNLVPNTSGYNHEIGLKFDAWHNKLSGNLSIFQATAANDSVSVSNLLKIVNPAGISNQNAPSNQGNFAVRDKQSRGIELQLTAAVTPNWRTRLVATFQDGTIKSDSKYAMLYNDEFYLNKTTGNVSYGSTSGAVVMVPSDAAGLKVLAGQSQPIDMANSAAVTAAGYNPATLVPLTIGMINDPSSAYYAFGSTGTAFAGNTPFVAANQPLNGSIGGGTGGVGSTTPYLKNALLNFQSGTATAYTGRTGLPFSAMQYNFADPAGYQGTYIVNKKGEATVGYGKFKINLTNDYTIRQGFLDGVHIGASVAMSWQNRNSYYATPDRIRHLYLTPELNPMVNSWLGYRHKFKRATWNTQVNINNMFNKYEIDFTPNNGTGFTNPANLGIAWHGEPRIYVWSNTVNF